MFGNKGYDIFLGGTCNGSTWRNEFLEKIQAINKNIKCFNPVVENWTEQSIELENFVKMNATYHIYVLTPLIAGVYTIAEMVESTMSDKKTYFCILDSDKDKNGEEIHYPPNFINSLNATSNLLLSHGAIKANSINDLVNKIVDDYNNTPRIRSPFNKK